MKYTRSLMGAKNRDAKTTHDRLQEWFPDLDHTLKKRDVFSVKENGVCYRLKNLGTCRNVDYQVDGSLIPGSCEGQIKCDRLLLIRVSETQWIQVFIELKATDAKHGLEQLEAILLHPLFKPLASNERRVARLVPKSMPSSKNNPEIHRLKERIAKLNCTFKTMKPNQAEDFETLKQLVRL